MQPLLDILRSMLEQHKADYEILSHNRPLISKDDAARVFDLVKAAPVFILEADGELVALLASAARGRIDLKALAGCGLCLAAPRAGGGPADPHRGRVPHQ